MKRFFLISLLITLLTGFSSLFAQGAGAVAGRVLDSETGEAMLGVTVIIPELQLFAVTDLDGNYYIGNVPTGKHLMRFQIAGYKTSQTNVSVTPGATKRVNITMGYQTLETVVVTAKRVDNTTASLLTKRRKAAAAQDAISAEQISKSPDSDAADAAKRVTGVTIVGGDTVFVRGLGERYSGVMFAGSSVPSPNPDKRVVPLSIFPVGVLDNIVISKTYTADMPGEFGGGIVQINPKDFPDEMNAKVSVSTGYNSLTTGKPFDTFQGGETDWLGFDDGTRDLPSLLENDNADNLSTADALTAAQQFHHVYTPEETTGILPASFSAEFGNSYRLGETAKLGIIASGMFKESSQNKEVEYNVHTGTNYEKQYDIDSSTYSTMKGGLLSFSFQPSSKNKIRTTNFYTHQSDKSAVTTEGYYKTYDQSDIVKIYDLRFVEETLLFNQFNGKHSFSTIAEPVLNWTTTYSRATRDEPSRNTTTLALLSDGDFTLKDPSGATSIFYQDHIENIYDLKGAVDLYFKQWSGLKSKFTAGSGYLIRNRESQSRTFNYSGSNTTEVDEPLDDNIPTDLDNGTLTLSESTPANNSYRGELTILSGYGQIDMPLVRKLRMIAGVRYENAFMDVISYNPVTSTEEGLDENPLAYNQVLPTANFVYELTKNINIRTAFSKTISRPDFREVSQFKYTTMVGNLSIIGNPELVETNIYNGDLRIEWFPSSAEILATSFFYKNMQNPIELVEANGGENREFSYQNAKEAENMGIEFEARKNLEFISKYIKDISFYTNLAFIYSQIDVSGLETKYTNETRPLQGQSPYIVNIGFDYENEKLGLSNTILYNRYGRRIVAVGLEKGGAKFGDEYEEPVDRLDYVIKKSFSFGGSLKFTAANILDPEIEKTQIINEGETNEVKYTTEKYKAGRSFSIGYSQKF